MTESVIETAAAAASSTSLQSRRGLYVGGLADALTETTLRAAMIPFGPIRSIDIPKDYVKGTNKGFGFVEYEYAEDAAEALFNMDGAELLGRALNVNLAHPNQHKLGSSKPVWSSDDWFKKQAGEEKDETPAVDVETDATALQEK